MNQSLDNLDRPVKIVIVDDESVNLLILSAVLTKAGYQVKQFESGNSAYDDIILTQPDLVLLDILMPQTDGYEICRMLKNNPVSKDIPVIFISALDGGSDIAKAFLVGGADYIIKPFKKEEILFRIKNQLELANSRKHLNQQIEQQQHFQHDLLDSIPNPVYFTDLDGRFLGCNSAFELCFDLKNEQLANKTIQDLEQENYARTAMEYFRSFHNKELELISSDNHYLSIESKIRYADGTLHDTVTSKTVFFEPNNNQQYVIFVLTDITGLLALEEKLRRSQKMEAIGVLAAGIAHEINSPMQYILDNTRFLEDRFKDFLTILNNLKNISVKESVTVKALFSEQLEACDNDFFYKEIPLAINETISGITKVRNIVAALKDFSFPRNNVLTEVDINKVMESILLITTSNWKHNALIEKDFADNLPLLPCYVDELNQVFINLIVNAVDAIREKNHRDGIIKISTSISDNFLKISVQDNGIGISHDVKDKIFEPFFTTKDVGQGTGQGLSISYDIVYNLHKGAIEVVSEVGKGTEFIVKLPMFRP